MANKYNLQRFHTAQEGVYPVALEEIRTGRKRSHWMWFIFPQIAGLGFSETAQYYAIQSIGEAEAYLTDEVLGQRLIEISGTLLTLAETNPTAIFGRPDDKKLRSSMTLFTQVPCANSVFQRVLDKFFDGKPDERTMRILGM